VLRMTLALGISLAVALSGASEVFAQSNKAPPTARDVLLLITEKVALERGESPAVRYWWIEPDSPQWTESDERLRDEIAEAGVELVSLSGQQRISRIYRMPSLSLSNAATLGSLLGARRVIVGTISYQRQPGIDVLGLQRVDASAEVSLMSAESGESEPLQRFTVEREAFAADPDEALERVRREASAALATVVASTLMRGAGPVGVHTDEQLIGLRNVDSARALEAIKTFLEGLDEVDAVGVRWAAEGLIALEINPGDTDSEATLEYVSRALTNQSFEDFAVSTRANTSSNSLIEFDVEHGDRESF
jgi:hypothetical protein